MEKTVLITGSSGGIGFELAELFARNQHNLVLVARSQDQLMLQKEQLEANHGIKAWVIAKDLSLPNAPEEIMEELKKGSIYIHILVNNAGFGSYGSFAESDKENQLEMIDLNIKSLTHLTKLILPEMIQRGEGRILNVASTASFQPGPLMAVYYASKAYVLSFTEAIANELKDQGITVSALCPGPTQTGFGQRANLTNSKLFKGSVMDAKTVAKFGFDGLMNNQTIIIPGFRNKFMSSSVRFLPRTLVTSIVRKMQDSR